MDKKLRRKLDKISKTHFGYDLKAKGLDRLDFKRINVLFLRDAIQEAYEQGQADLKAQLIHC